MQDNQDVQNANTDDAAIIPEFGNRRKWRRRYLAILLIAFVFICMAGAFGALHYQSNSSKSEVGTWVIVEESRKNKGRSPAYLSTSLSYVTFGKDGTCVISKRPQMPGVTTVLTCSGTYTIDADGKSINFRATTPNGGLMAGTFVYNNDNDTYNNDGYVNN